MAPGRRRRYERVGLTAFERRLCPRNVLGEVSEGAVEAPSDD